MENKEEIKIILVDDHVMFLEGLRALCQDDDAFNIVAAVPTGEEVLTLLKKELVQVVVTDLSMPTMDGLELNKRIKKNFPSVKTLVLSTHNSAEQITKLMKNDVDGYLLKNAEPDTLKYAIYELAKGKKYFAEEVKEKYMNSLFSGEEKEDVHLTNREKEILKLISSEYTTSKIAEELFISEHTVNSHRKNILSKLNVKNTAGLVKCAIRLGLI